MKGSATYLPKPPHKLSATLASCCHKVCSLALTPTALAISPLKILSDPLFLQVSSKT